MVIKREIYGDIEDFLERGGFDISVVTRDCPYCWNNQEQPVSHLHLNNGSMFGTYICSKCATYYYFVGDNIYQYIPEAQLVHVENYVKRPSRLDTIKTYRNLYYRAKEFEWFNVVRLDITDEIIENVWTMPVEVSAQIMEKEKSGKAPGFSVGFLWLGDEEKSSYPLDGDDFMKALDFLKEEGLIRE